MFSPETFPLLLRNIRMAIEGVEQFSPSGRWAHSSPSSFKRQPLDNEYLQKEKWLENEDPEDPNHNQRFRSYLLGYLAAAGGDSFPALGIRLEGGKYIHPDKGVMKAHLLYRHVELISGAFRLTESGRAYLNGVHNHK